MKERMKQFEHYTLLTMEDFIKINLNKYGPEEALSNIEVAKDIFNEIADGENFIVAIGSVENLHYFSLNQYKNEILK